MFQGLEELRFSGLKEEMSNWRYTDYFTRNAFQFKVGNIYQICTKQPNWVIWHVDQPYEINLGKTILLKSDSILTCLECDYTVQKVRHQSWYQRFEYIRGTLFLHNGIVMYISREYTHSDKEIYIKDLEYDTDFFGRSSEFNDSI